MPDDFSKKLKEIAPPLVTGTFAHCEFDPTYTHPIRICMM
jgi:hypothetical protein